MTISVLIPAVFVAYTLLCWILFGPLPSLSSTYYKWKARNYSAAWPIFSAVVFLLCVLHYKSVKEMTLMWLCVSAFCMWSLTVAAEYKKYPLHHYIPTVATIIAGFIAGYTEFGKGIYLPFFMFAAGTIVLAALKVPNRLTWIELLAVLAIFWPFMV